MTKLFHSIVFSFTTLPLVVHEDRKRYSARLTELRNLSPHSYQRLEQMLGRPSATISEWCTGKQLPDPRDNDTFGQLLALLGLEPDEQTSVLRQAGDLRAREKTIGRLDR